MEKHPLDEIRDTLEEDLHATGFSPQANPPGAEPRFPAEAATRTTEQLRQLYDDYLAFYEYLTDRIIELMTFLGPSQAKLQQEKAAATLEVASNKAYSNAELRDAAVTTNPRVRACVEEVTYYKTLLESQEERRRKMSKAMERLYREIYLRTEQQGPQFPQQPSRFTRR